MRHIRDLRVGHDLVSRDQGSLAAYGIASKHHSSWDSEMSVTTSLVASFAKPFPFLRLSRPRFGCGLACCTSSSSLCAGAGAFVVAAGGATSGDGDTLEEAGLGSVVRRCYHLHMLM